MYYFKFAIPANADGSRVTYSPGWHGEMSRCPEGVKVLLYNDKEGYGIARVEDPLIEDCAKRGECELIKEVEATLLLSQSINQLTDGDKWKPIFLTGVLLPKDAEYLSNTVEHRWDDAVKELEANQKESITASVEQRAVFCPVCHLFIMWLPTSLKSGTINLTCPVGHKVVLNGE